MLIKPKLRALFAMGEERFKHRHDDAGAKAVGAAQVNLELVEQLQ